LDKGDTFTVLLVTNPTTGFLWKFGNPAFDDKVMILHGDKFIQPEKKDMCGAPGKRSLTFLAEGPGRTGLKLVYVRPWEKNRPPAHEFNLTVIVKDAPAASAVPAKK
jgi:inhibitor of cysteine peptidase